MFLACVALAFFCAAAAQEQETVTREELAAEYTRPLIEGHVNGRPVYYYAPLGSRQASRSSAREVASCQSPCSAVPARSPRAARICRGVGLLEVLTPGRAGVRVRFRCKMLWVEWGRSTQGFPA